MSDTKCRQCPDDIVKRATHAPCCSSHKVPLCCRHYRRTHFVEVGRCCKHDSRPDSEVRLPSDQAHRDPAEYNA